MKNDLPQPEAASVRVCIPVSCLQLSTLNKIKTSSKEITKTLRKFRTTRLRNNPVDLRNPINRIRRRSEPDKWQTSFDMENDPNVIATQKNRITKSQHTIGQPDKLINTTVAHSNNDKPSLSKSLNRPLPELKEMQPKNIEIIKIDDDAPENIKSNAANKSTAALNDPIVLKHKLPVMTALLDRPVAMVKNPTTIDNTNPSISCKTQKSKEVQTDDVHILTEDEQELFKLIQSSGLNKLSLARAINAYLSHTMENNDEDINNNTENQSNFLQRTDNEIINLCDADDTKIDSDKINKLIFQSEQNKALINKIYRATNRTAKNELVKYPTTCKTTVNVEFLVTTFLESLDKVFDDKSATLSFNKYTQYSQTDCIVESQNYIGAAVFSPISEASNPETTTTSNTKSGMKSLEMVPLREFCEQTVPQLQALAVNDQSKSVPEQQHNIQQKQYPQQNTQQYQYQFNNTQQDPSLSNNTQQQILQQKQYQQFRPNSLPANNYTTQNYQNYTMTMNAQMQQQLLQQQSYAKAWNAKTDNSRSANATIQPTSGVGNTVPTDQRYYENLRQQELVKLSHRGRKSRSAAPRNAPYSRLSPQQQRNQYLALLEQQKIQEAELQQRHWESQLQNYPNSSWTQAQYSKRAQ